jgi:hypothetical protein
MIPINVFPAKQGFDPPPDGGVVVPNTLLPGSLDVVEAGKQGFPPAPNLLFNFTGPFPTPAEPPFRPADVGVPPIPSLSSPIPQAIEVDVNKAAGQFASLNPRDVVISDAGSFEVNPGQVVQNYTVSAFVDNETGLPATSQSVNLRLTLGAPPLPLAGGAPLTSYGVTLSGRSLLFATLNAIPPERVILVWGVVANANLVVVANEDAKGVKLVTALSLSVGDLVAFDSARQSSEVVFQNGSIVDVVIPMSLPLLDPPVGPSTLQPILNVNTTEQISSFPNPETVFVPQNPVSLVQQIPGLIPNVDVIKQPPFIGLPENHPSEESMPASASKNDIVNP